MDHTNIAQDLHYLFNHEKFLHEIKEIEEDEINTNNRVMLFTTGDDEKIAIATNENNYIDDSWNILWDSANVDWNLRKRERYVIYTYIMLKNKGDFNIIEY